VRLKGDGDGFVRSLTQEGCRCDRGRHDLLKVVLPPDRGAEMIFRAAQQSGVQVRHLMHQRDSLEDVFIEAVEETEKTRMKAEG